MGALVTWEERLALRVLILVLLLSFLVAAWKS